MGGDTDTQRAVMAYTLQVAVPMWLWTLNQHRGDYRETVVAKWAADAADAVASRGDVLQFGGKRGEAADVFNHLARGVAALSTCPGGLCFLGIVWCARHSPGGRTAEPSEALCAQCISDDRHGPTLDTETAKAGRQAFRRIETANPREGIL